MAASYIVSRAFYRFYLIFLPVFAGRHWPSIVETKLKDMLSWTFQWEFSWKSLFDFHETVRTFTTSSWWNCPDLSPTDFIKFFMQTETNIFIFVLCRLSRQFNGIEFDFVCFLNNIKFLQKYFCLSSRETFHSKKNWSSDPFISQTSSASKRKVHQVYDTSSANTLESFKTKAMH